MQIWPISAANSPENYRRIRSLPSRLKRNEFHTTSYNCRRKLQFFTPANGLRKKTDSRYFWKVDIREYCRHKNTVSNITSDSFFQPFGYLVEYNPPYRHIRFYDAAALWYVAGWRFPGNFPLLENSNRFCISANLTWRPRFLKLSFLKVFENRVSRVLRDWRLVDYWQMRVLNNQNLIIDKIFCMKI